MNGHEPPEPREAERVVCTRCRGEQFRLYAGGGVYCAGCGARMGNCRLLLRVPVDAQPSPDGPH
ncbi:MAG: hypothetical protein HYU77_13790 [Betaproteobacteria bacterium]|nr:hypothetical protein [Betaproteobacteria bacterium]